MNFLFPYKEPRKIQNALMAQISSCLQNKQNLLAHAPTGLGKTAAVLSTVLPYAMEKNLTLFFLTPRHSQHFIAVETIKEIRSKFKLDFQVADFIGKKHMCLQPGVDPMPNGEFHEYCRDLRKHDHCEFYLNLKDKPRRELCLNEAIIPLHVEELKEKSRQYELCPYEVSAILAKKARVIIADYYHILSPSIREPLLTKINKELSQSIICFDEAHNLPDKCRDLLTANLSSLTVDRALRENKVFNFDYEEDLFNLQNNLSQLAKTISIEKQEALVKKNDFLADISLIKPMQEAAEIVRDKQKKSSLGVVANFLEAWHGPDRSFVRIIQKGFTKFSKPYLNLSYRCLDPSLLISQLHAHSMIFMSGTLSPVNMYQNLLGLNNQKTITAEYENPFPPNNRLNIIAPTTTTKFTKRDGSMYKRISNICSDITNIIPGNTAIFFPSYELRNQVNHFFQHEANKTIFSEQPGLTKQERQSLIEKFKSYHERGAVLLGVASGSFGEGIDLPGSFLKAVIVVGLPLARPDLETQELINYYDELFAKGWDYAYIYPAIIKSLQNAGRCIRSETDKGCIVFLDERYAWDSYKKCFPTDAHFEITKLPQELVRKFFKDEVVDEKTKNKV